LASFWAIFSQTNLVTLSAVQQLKKLFLETETFEARSEFLSSF
jgi:hypothetical protein